MILKYQDSADLDFPGLRRFGFVEFDSQQPLLDPGRNVARIDAGIQVEHPAEVGRLAFVVDDSCLHRGCGSMADYGQLTVIHGDLDAIFGNPRKFHLQCVAVGVMVEVRPRRHKMDSGCSLGFRIFC